MRARWNDCNFRFYDLKNPLPYRCRCLYKPPNPSEKKVPPYYLLSQIHFFATHMKFVFLKPIVIWNGKRGELSVCLIRTFIGAIWRWVYGKKKSRRNYPTAF